MPAEWLRRAPTQLADSATGLTLHPPPPPPKKIRIRHAPPGVGCYQQAVEDGELPRGVTLLSNGATGPRSWRGEAADLRLALQALGARGSTGLPLCQPAEWGVKRCLPACLRVSGRPRLIAGLAKLGRL